MPSPFDVTTPGPDTSLRTLFGAPTYEQAGASSRAKLMKALSDAHAKNGGNPQQAVMDVLKSPEGLEHITNMGMMHNGGPETMSVFKDFIQNATPPQTTLGPGQSLVSGTGANAKTVASNPTTDLQTTAGLAAMASSQNNPVLAEMAYAKGMGDKGAETVAVKRAIAAGYITPEFGQKWLSGMIVKMKQMNPSGETIGEQWVDASDPQNLKSISEATVKPTAPQVPGATGPSGAPVPAQPNVDKDAEWQKVLNDPKESAPLSTGFGPMATITAGKIGQSANPAMNNEWTQAKEMLANRQKAIETTRAALSSVPEAQGRLKDKLKIMLNLLPSIHNPFQDPVDSIADYRKLREFATEEMQSAYADWTNPINDRKVKAEGNRSMIAWQKVLATMPSERSLDLQLEAVRAGKSQYPTIPDMVGNAVGAAKDVGRTVGEGVAAVKGAVAQTGGGVTPETVAKMSEQQIRDAEGKGLLKDPALRAAAVARIKQIRGAK